MMLLDIPPTVLQRFGDPDDHDDPYCSAVEAALMALSLFTVWTARTGRVLRPVPITELTAQELEDFWVDDQLEESEIPASPRGRQG